MQKRMDMDLHRLSIPGIYIYALILPIIFLTFDFHVHHPLLSFVYSIIMLMLSSLRLIHAKFSLVLYEKSRQLWFYLLTSLQFTQAGIIGTVLALAMYDPRFSSINHMIILAISAISSGALIAQTPQFKVALSNLIVLLLPSLLVYIFVDSYFNFVFLFIFYGIGQIFILLHAHKNYYRGLLNEEELTSQRKSLEAANKLDPLTKIYNRGYFNTAYELNWEMAIRHKHSQALLIIDVDYFKAVNDNHGHLVGDKCLISVANIINSVARRKTDLVARFGGEEFIILLDDTPKEAVLELAEEIRSAVAESVYKEGDTNLKVTVSIGVSITIPQLNMPPNDLIKTADKALYRAKEAGRNRVCYYSNQQCLLKA